MIPRQLSLGNRKGEKLKDWVSENSECPHVLASSCAF